MKRQIDPFLQAIAKQIVEETFILQRMILWETDTERLLRCSSKLFLEKEILEAVEISISNDYLPRDPEFLKSWGLDYWQAVVEYMPWDCAAARESFSHSAFIRSHGVSHTPVVLLALGQIGNFMSDGFSQRYNRKESLLKLLSPLANVSWSRGNPDWWGWVLSDGLRLHLKPKTDKSIKIMTSYLLRFLMHDALEPTKCNLPALNSLSYWENA